MYRPDTLALTALLGLLTAFGPLSTDMYLPSLPDIGRALNASTAKVQLTLSAFLVGFAIGQVIFGPISDRYGRKPVLLASLALYALASIACALATTIDLLIIARFVQAIGACGPIVLARAIVRDLYSGPRAGRELSIMGTIMGIVPALAPILGGLLHIAFGWTSSFWFTGLFGLITMVIVVARLPETVLERSTAPISPLGIIRTYGTILKNRAFVAYTTMFAATYGGLFSFISGSSFVLQDLYGLSPDAYGAAFGFTVIGFISGTLIGTRLVQRRGLNAALRLGVLLLLTASATMILGVALAIPSAFAVLVPMAIYTGGVGLMMPNSMAGALTPFPDRAGAASSLVGFLQMSFAALVGIVVGHALGSSAWPMVIAIAVLGCTAATAYWLSRGIRGVA
jgi:DHA1 family bicyclomycin/chloramphenicol resistance-like MFS transporter